MNAETFITNMVARLGRRTDLQSVLLDIMNDVKETTLEKQSWFPWFLERDSIDDVTPPSTVVGSEMIALPEGFLGQVEDSAVFLLDEDAETEKELVKVFSADALLSVALTDELQVYWLRGKSNMRVRGLPTEVQSLRMQYYRADDAFASGETNQWLTEARAVVYAEVGRKCAADYIKDYTMAGKFEQEAARAWDQLAKENTARQEAGVSRVKGD